MPPSLRWFDHPGADGGQLYALLAPGPRLLLVVPGKCSGQENPDARECQIERREAGDRQSQSRSRIDDAGLKHVAEAPEEAVDGSFGFILRFPAHGEKQGLARGILDGIVVAVVEDLEHADESQEWRH